ncbi:MAG TPA: hypothetical protein VGO58_04650 [Chitinophagaceae bacterium]|jgi:hypothetical protein|nr:hypothetical protein [Chitinophagaceae bacterium]
MQQKLKLKKINLAIPGVKQSMSSNAGGAQPVCRINSRGEFECCPLICPPEHRP